VLGIRTVECGEGEDIARAVPVPVDRHEDLLAMAVFHLEDKLPERGTIVQFPRDWDI